MNDAAYARAYRQAHPDYVDRLHARQRARERARQALARAHPAEYTRLLRRELAALGVEPRAPGRPRKAQAPASEAT